MSVTIDDFKKLSIQIGKVTAAERIPGKTKILKLQVDIGEKVAQAIAGGAEFYEPSTFIGRRVVVLSNMEAKTVAGVKSEVMLLAADHQGKPIWLTVDEDVPAGARVQ